VLSTMSREQVKAFAGRRCDSRVLRECCMSLARVREEIVLRTSVWTCALRGGRAWWVFNAVLGERELPLSKPFIMNQSDVKLCCSVRDVMMVDGGG